jgi:hypothetical protein
MEQNQNIEGANAPALRLTLAGTAIVASGVAASLTIVFAGFMVGLRYAVGS